MEIQIDEQVEFHAYLLSHIAHAIVAINTEQRITYWNRGAEQLFGVTADAALGRPLTQICAAVWLSSMEAQEELAYTGQWHGEQIVNTPGEVARDVEASVSWLTDRHGHLTGWLAVLRDVTERKRVEADCARLLRQEQAAAEEAVRRRERFISIAAHELQTPLTILFGHAQLLEQRLTNNSAVAERDRLAAGMITAEAIRLNKRIMRLLDLSRLQTGQFQIARSRIDLGTLVRRVVEQRQGILDTHTITFHNTSEPLVIIGDELSLEQVLQNLLENAITYSPPRRPITIRVERRDDRGCVIVADQGIGIPQMALPDLFRIFYRASNAGSAQVGGLGIGLHIVKQIVTLHGGAVEVESAEGVGSTFTIALPLAEI